jgi:hypothetical protein
MGGVGMGIEKLLITMEEKSALVEIQKNFIADYGVEELVAFGSGVRSEATRGGVPDLLALTAKPMSPQNKQAMLDLVAKVNLEYHTSYTVLVFDKATWEIWAGQTLYQEIKKDGLQIW